MEGSMPIQDLRGRRCALYECLCSFVAVVYKVEGRTTSSSYTFKKRNV